MAKYCRDCSLRIFDKDFRDFAHNEEAPMKVFCIACGYIKVDKNGKKI